MTNRQKNRAKLVGKYRTTQEELLAAGYSPEVARTQPKGVMKAKGWLKLLDEKLPDEGLLEKHQALLNKKEVIVSFNPVTKSNERTYTGEVDTAAVGRGLDMAYKLKGKYVDGNTMNIQVNNIIPILGDMKAE